MNLSYPTATTPGEKDMLIRLQTYLSELFGPVANQLARATGFVQREREINGTNFARTLVFGFQQHPDASYSDLQQTMATQGVVVSQQAIEQRMRPEASEFALQLCQHLLTDAIVGPDCPLGTLSGFNGVYLQDGTSISLPDEAKEQWPGSGTRTGSGGEARLRVQVRLDLQRGGLSGPYLQAGREAERSGASSVEENPLPEGSLYVTDTGYVTLERIQQYEGTKRFFLAPASMRAKVIDAHGISRDLPEFLACRVRQGYQRIDEWVELGVSQRVRVRLIALPNAHPAKRRRDTPPRRKGARHDVQVGRKKGLKGERGRKNNIMSRRRYQMRDWTVIVTNVATERLTSEQARELLRARWQSELLWKLWKQSAHLDVWRSEKLTRILCEVYAKLIGVTIGHWFTIVGCWQQVHRSLVQASKVVQKLSMSVLLTLDGPIDLSQVLARSSTMMRRCRLNPRRKHPNTSQHLVEVFLC